MKILHFITSLKIGGAEAALYNLLEFCTERHDQLDRAVVYIHGGPFVDRVKSLGIPVYRLKGAISPYDPISLYRLAKLVKKLQPDIIHSSLWSANIMARMVAWRYKIPLVSDLHGNCAFYGCVRNTIGRAFLSTPAKFVAVATPVKESFLTHFGKNKNVSANTIMIPNGIDAKKLRQKADENRLSRDELGFGKSDFVVGSVGRLHRIKRYDLLIRAFAQAANSVTGPRKFRLCLVGGGPERERLERVARECGVSEFVFFAGEQSEPYRYYPLFDVFVLSSLSEGMSIAMLEALSFFLPIVLTLCEGASGAFHDVISHGVNGLLLTTGGFDPLGNRKDHEVKLSQALLKLFNENSLVYSIRKENRKLIQERFCINAVRESFEKLYKELTHT